MYRRKFIQTAAAAGLLSQLPAAALSAPPVSPQEKTAEKFRERMIPIGDAERASRVDNARRLMAAAGIDALLLEGGTTMRYFTGVRWGRSERLFLMVLPVRGEPFFLSPKFEESRASEQVGRASLYTWEENESPYLLLAKTMREKGVATGSIALEESTRHFAAEGIGKVLGGASIVSGTPVTAECRAVKSKTELDLMQLANDITAEVYKAALPQLKAGMKEREFGRVISSGFSQFGVRGGALVLFGEASAHPHGLEKESTLKEGDIVLIDGGCSVEQYVSDVTRTTIFGRPTDRMSRPGR
jgi:Xaa-Pro dipeptidase